MAENPIEIWFFDPSLTFIGLEDHYEAIRYRQRWNTYGDFEICLCRMIPQAKLGNIVVFGHNGRKNGVIRYIRMEEDGKVRIRGYSLLWLLTQRITIPPAGEDCLTVSDTQENVMRTLVDQNAIHPENVSRIIPHLSLGKRAQAGRMITFQSRYAGLDREIGSLSESSGLGVSIDFDYQRQECLFCVRQGTDRSCEQEKRSPVIFCMDYDTIESRTYEISDMDAKTCAVIAGKGEGADRAVYVYGDELAMNERREIFIDAKDIKDPLLLPERAATKLAEWKPAEAYECILSLEGYAKKWDIGDYVTVLDPELGIRKRMQITAVEESVDRNGGYEVEATAGEAAKSVAEHLRNRTAAGSAE
ncbi:MAG: hypothetical protein HFI38_02420 [Lachnospiraceae bacterium]|jgi:hypothetical protein|nr:hypothetical protein [Lachnospiraceae bacterium]